MTTPAKPAPRRGFGPWLLPLAVAALAALLLAPGVAAGAGRLLGGLWVTVMGAVLAIVGALFGG